MWYTLKRMIKQPLELLLSIWLIMQRPTAATYIRVKWTTKSLNSQGPRDALKEPLLECRGGGFHRGTRPALCTFQGPSSEFTRLTNPPAVARRRFRPWSDDYRHLAERLLRLWPQLRGMSLDSMWPVTDFIPCVTQNTLQRGTNAPPLSSCRGLCRPVINALNVQFTAVRETAVFNASCQDDTSAFSTLSIIKRPSLLAARKSNSTDETQNWLCNLSACHNGCVIWVWQRMVFQK